MKRVKKIVFCLLAAASAAFGMAGTTATAYHDNGTYCSWDWGYKTVSGTTNAYAKTTSKCADSRIIKAEVEVFQDGTGIWVNDYIDSATGGYGTNAEARASCSQYPSSQYNYRSSGCIYNSHLAISGVAETWGPKSFG